MFGKKMQSHTVRQFDHPTLYLFQNKLNLPNKFFCQTPLIFLREPISIWSYRLKKKEPQKLQYANSKKKFLTEAHKALENNAETGILTVMLQNCDRSRRWLLIKSPSPVNFSSPWPYNAKFVFEHITERSCIEKFEIGPTIDDMQYHRSIRCIPSKQQDF